MLNTLRVKGWIWVFGSLLLGSIATWIWTSSQSAWEKHLDQAFVNGTALYSTLRFGEAAPSNIAVVSLETSQSADGSEQKITSPNDLSSSGFVTTVFINTNSSQVLSGDRLQLHIVSPDIRYPVSKLDTSSGKLPSAQMGDVIRLLANYCSKPKIFARFGTEQWQLIDGEKVWGCDAAPIDLRIPAVLMLVLGASFFLSQVTETAAQFSRFELTLKQRQRLGGSEAFNEEGTVELKEIKKTLNEYLSLERDQLEKRAMVMSGVSHDLGVPATRLRLRTALIEDDKLRTKLEADIDQMTGMIESVLTYTRSEMNSEEMRQVSLTSLVQSIVADYADVGKSVRYQEDTGLNLNMSRSVFGRGGNFSPTREESRRTLVTASPVSLRRAISNLIDNSLKYGRKATVSVTTGSNIASVIVEDEGSGVTEEIMNSLIAPFQRGENAHYIEGVGLGLTIVATIARQHGGDVHFEQTSSGLRSILTISR